MQSLYGAIANTNKKEIMVSVDAVYQKVLAIANKEQRGYITPQEFNLFADHAQKDIFRQYFYDLDRIERRTDSDIVELLEQKISIFQTAPIQVNHGYILPENTHQIDDVSVSYSGSGGAISPVQRVNRKDVQGIQSGPLLRAHFTTCYYTYGNQVYFVLPPNNPTPTLYLNLIRKPVSPNWTYVISGESAMFDDLVPGFQNFELHDSEETLLVIKILQLAGINIKDPALVQIASQEEIKKIQQEKQ